MSQIWTTDWPQQIKCADTLKYGQIHTPVDCLVHLLTIYFQPKLGDAEPSPFGHTCVCQCCTSPGLSARWKTHSALGQAEEVKKERTKTHSVQTCKVTKTDSAVWSKTKPLSLSHTHTHTNWWQKAPLVLYWLQMQRSCWSLETFTLTGSSDW